MAKDNSNEIILCYYDCVLRVRDVALLRGTHWLNDVIVGFYFEYLDVMINKNGKKEIYFISPELTQLLKLTDPSQYNLFFNDVSVAECKCIVFPLNDCDNRESAGGSHWSLLVYCKQEKTCYHFDSSKGCNYSIAENFAKNVMNYMLDKDEPNKKFIEPDCPQQDNAYDCGIYVLCLTDIVTEYVLKTGKLSDCNYSQAKNLVSTKRTQLLNLINEIKHEESTEK
ncbi:PREDICTED: sentrin-specific protease 8-like [Dufourea novaeangliae]|uniref:Sentrin-specific protease 8 n=1 Tax=Dufourea novaeangliae TaxID=178035 RepID=A0A154P9Q5_DUFNO|nr:PREDICTED: sentrin-specific protease 8-like [Dufourea novaeangliae]KZC08124.1 Sentrin-specific protease 8 [Dufourea novaeangliae]